MPETLINATIDYHAGRIDAATYAQRIAARRDHEFRAKQHPDPEGHQRLMCPAAGVAPTARCDLKPASLTRRTAGRTRVFFTDDLSDHPPAACRQQTVTFPPEAGAKYRQTLPYAGPDWKHCYHTLRNGIEGFNGIVKDGAREALADPQRRRIRGVAAQTVFVALALFAANIRMIDQATRGLAVVDPDGTTRRPRPRRRTTRPLSSWHPAAPARERDPPAS